MQSQQVWLPYLSILNSINSFLFISLYSHYLFSVFASLLFTSYPFIDGQAIPLGWENVLQEIAAEILDDPSPKRLDIWSQEQSLNV